MNASLRLMRSSRSISYWDLGATGMFDGILLVLGFPAGYAGVVLPARGKGFLAACGLSTRFRSSVRCREAARGDGGLCGLFPDSWRELLYAACGARFRARSRGAARIPHEKAIGGRWSSTVRYTRKSSSFWLGLSVWRPASPKPLAFLLFESGIHLPSSLAPENNLPTSSGGDTGPKNPITCPSRAPRCHY